MKRFVTFIMVALFCASYSWAQDCDIVLAGDVCDTNYVVEHKHKAEFNSDRKAVSCDAVKGAAAQFRQGERRGFQDSRKMVPQKPGQKFMKKGAPDFEQIMSQKIAFYTKELDLSSEEAMKFWPVYNEYSKAQCAAHMETMNALKALKKAIRSREKANMAKSDSKNVEKQGQEMKPATEKEVDELAQKYIKAQEKEKVILANYYPKFKGVLPVSKAAKIFSIEEKFRSFLIKGLKKH